MPSREGKSGSQPGLGEESSLGLDPFQQALENTRSEERVQSWGRAQGSFFCRSIKTVEVGKLSREDVESERQRA